MNHPDEKILHNRGNTIMVRGYNLKPIMALKFNNWVKYTQFLKRRLSIIVYM